MWLWAVQLVTCLTTCVTSRVACSWAEVMVMHLKNAVSIMLLNWWRVLTLPISNTFFYMIVTLLKIIHSYLFAPGRGQDNWNASEFWQSLFIVVMFRVFTSLILVSHFFINIRHSDYSLLCLRSWPDYHDWRLLWADDDMWARQIVV